MISRLNLEFSMRRLAALVVVALAFCGASQSAWAGKRVALVIGNSSYQNVPPLTNPVNDATAIAEMFRKAAFDEVVARLDLKYMEMRRALRDFTDKARGADIAVIYFAGHGLEVDGVNYTVPVDATLERDADADDEAVSLNRILLAAEPATKLRLVILDACRDNPFTKKMKRTISSRSLGRGLIGVEANKPNTFIAFAAKEGSTASDGDGKNSPFSTALLKHLTTPGLDIRKAFGFVRDDVMSATGDQQEPYTTNSLGGNDVALVPAPAAPPPVASDPNADIRRDYELAERVGTNDAWASFIAAHPAGFYADLAKAQRSKLAAEAERIAATEKARTAADERARLAAEGARAGEQSKAAEQAKAAEEARLAAENKKRAEEAKVAAAEQVKLAEQAKIAEQQRQAADNAKKLEQAKIASAEPPKPAGDQPGTAKPADPAVASLAPPGATPDRALPPDLPRLLQSELKRVGCKTGDVGSDWSAAARKALSSFNDNARTRFDVQVASIDALDAVRSKPGRVCPLDCERGYRASGDQCVKIACDDGYVLGSNGSCQKRSERAPKVSEHERRAPAGAKHGGKCFVFNGNSFCE
jgi:uncharacterized caspase-like protein